MLALWTLAGHRGCRLGFRFVICLREFVVHLLQEPILTSSLSHFGFQDGPLTPKLRAVQSESHEAVSERRRRVDSCRSDHLKFAVVPHDDFARAIFAFRKSFLEQKIVERVVLNMNREALYLGIFAWPLRNCPRDQSRSNFQSEVVVETPSPALLDHESAPWSSAPRGPFGTARRRDRNSLLWHLPQRHAQGERRLGEHAVSNRARPRDRRPGRIPRGPRIPPSRGRPRRRGLLRRFVSSLRGMPRRPRDVLREGCHVHI